MGVSIKIQNLKSKIEMTIDLRSPNFGEQRDWIWRGWPTRYSFLRAASSGDDRPPTILLHGFGLSSGHWRYNMEPLSDRRTVYALDLLGFGGSAKVLTAYSIAFWVEQVYEFWRTFVRRPVVLAGHSIGSLVVVAAAATYPEMVSHAVMVSLPDLELRQESIPRPLRGPVALLERLFASPLLLRPAFYFLRDPARLRPWLQIAYANADRVDDELIDIVAVPTRDRGAAATFVRLFRDLLSPHFCPSVRELLPQVRSPMLLFWGDRDRMVPPQLARPDRFRDYNPDLELQIVENAGHCPHDECPDRFNAALLAWLDRP